MKKIAFFLSLVCAGSPVLAYDAIVKAANGRVFLRTAKSIEFRPIKAGQKINADDQVRTGDDGLVQLAFKKSGATVLVKEKSQFSLKTDQAGDLLSFVRGEFLIGLKKRLGADRKFRVRTPACVAAVRGTVFWGLSDDDKNSTYACFTGSIEITAKDQSVLL